MVFDLGATAKMRAWRPKLRRGALRDPGRRALGRARRRLSSARPARRRPRPLDDDDASAQLQRLQYRSTPRPRIGARARAAGGAEPAHNELAGALGGARDATAEVAEALDEQGRDGVAPLLHEWRGALFRVRLARLRLAAPRSPEPVTSRAESRRARRAARRASSLALGGTPAFAIGATVGPWPLWVAGLIAVSAALLVYRP